jgi:hypothetical protein
MTKTKSHSSYWLDDSMYDDDDIIEKEETPVERIVRLSSVRRGIGNFVRILTNDPKIVVKFSSGKSSYTDGNTVVIAADDNPKNFDVMVGLALHEGSHCLLTDFDFLRTIVTQDDDFYLAMHPTLRKMLKIDSSKGQENMSLLVTVREYIKMLMNVIEDRRIDSYVYQNASGYRPYYDSMYKKYFFNSDVEKNMMHNPDWRVPSVENYVNWLIQIISPKFDPKALPGLKKMVNMIDLKNIRRFDEPKMPSRWPEDHSAKITHPYDITYVCTTYQYEKMPLLFRVANEIFIEILKQVKLSQIEQDSQKIDMGNGIILDGMDIDISEMNTNELPNLDVPQGRFNPAKAKTALEKMKKVLNGEIKKKKIKRSEEEQVDSMESANADMSETGDPVFGKIPCLVTKKLTKEILLSEWYPFANRWQVESDYARAHNNLTYRGFLAGIRMGQILAHRLAVRNDPTITHFTRQQHGKIDRRILSQLGMDIENVFKRTTVDTYKPALLHLSLDASGSMTGKKWEKVMTVATALAYAADKINNLDVQISLRGNMGSGLPVVSLVYDSQVDTFAKARSLFPHLLPAGSTPEGLCYPATLELMRKSTSTHRVYFINFSDGEPGCSYKYNGTEKSYGGDLAVAQTRRAIAEMRELGIDILSYFISESRYQYPSTVNIFRKMYGQSAEFVDVSNATSVIKTINKLLLVKE